MSADNDLATGVGVEAEAARWDAGALGCGELVIELRTRLKRMPGQLLCVVATDPGAPDDIPAWCRMTRNALERHDAATHRFWIRSRTDWG